MKLNLPDLKDVSAELVARYAEELAQRLEDLDPDLDVRGGSAFYSLIVYYNALLGARTQSAIRSYLENVNLEAAKSDPDVDDSIVDFLAANFLVSRKTSSRATGMVKVVVNRNVPVVVVEGAVFSASGQLFRSSRSVLAVPDEEFVQQPDTQILIPEQPGEWSFVVPVVAEEPGSAGMIKKGMAVVPSVPPNGYVRSVALDDFIGGRNTESNQDLLSRLASGIASANVSNRTCAEAWLRSIPESSSISNVSMVGFGDPEMRRDRDGLWPGSHGGKSDWYVRTSKEVLKRTLVKEAVLHEKLSDNTGLWQIVITRNEVPGFYEVDIRPKQDLVGSGSLSIIQETRLTDVAGIANAPYFNDPSESAFSAFQSASFIFHDPATDVSSLTVNVSKKPYQAVVSYLPFIGVLQSAVSDPSVRPMAGDVVIHAPVPCWVRVVIRLWAESSLPESLLYSVKNAVSEFINSVPFTGRVYHSDAVASVIRVIGSKAKLIGLDWSGRIKYPNGSIRTITGDEYLEVPEEPENGVSAKTVQFFCGWDSVTIRAPDNNL